MHTDSGADELQTTVVLFHPVQGEDSQWGVEMVMEGAALAGRREYHDRLARAMRKGIPPKPVMAGEATAEQWLRQQVQQLQEEKRQGQQYLQETEEVFRWVLQQSPQQVRQSQQRCMNLEQEKKQLQQLLSVEQRITLQIRQERQTAIMELEVSQRQVQQLQEQVSDMLSVLVQKFVCSTISAGSHEQGGQGGAAPLGSEEGGGGDDQ